MGYIEEMRIRGVSTDLDVLYLNFQQAYNRYLNANARGDVGEVKIMWEMMRLFSLGLHETTSRPATDPQRKLNKQFEASI